MRNLLTALLLLAAPAAFGQSPKEISQQVHAIQQQVRAISRNTLRRIDFSQAMQRPDTIRRAHLNFPIQYMAYYTPAGALQELQIKNWFASASTTYYLVSGEVVCIDSNYLNTLRMTSCGEVRSHIRYFLSRQQLLSSQAKQDGTRLPNREYCYQLAPAQELASLLQALSPALARVPPYRAAK